MSLQPFPDERQIQLLKYLVEHNKGSSALDGIDAPTLKAELFPEDDEYEMFVQDLIERCLLEKDLEHWGNPLGRLWVPSEGRDFLAVHLSQPERVAQERAVLDQKRTWELKMLVTTALVTGFFAALFVFLFQFIAKALGITE